MQVFGEWYAKVGFIHNLMNDNYLGIGVRFKPRIDASGAFREVGKGRIEVRPGQVFGLRFIHGGIINNGSDLVK